MTEKIFAIEYHYDLSRNSEITEIRPEHRLFLRSLFDSEKLLASGPLGAEHALIILRANTQTEALEILNEDPFQKAGLILHRNAKEWNPVIGPWN
ncbi:MAG: YciI family protein [Arcanobacterium sp.]|nr:YciI family protein [Arcanobacterium sp.]